MKLTSILVLLSIYIYLCYCSSSSSINSSTSIVNEEITIACDPRAPSFGFLRPRIEKRKYTMDLISPVAIKGAVYKFTYYTEEFDRRHYSITVDGSGEDILSALPEAMSFSDCFISEIPSEIEVNEVIKAIGEEALASKVLVADGWRTFDRDEFGQEIISEEYSRFLNLEEGSNNGNFAVARCQTTGSSPLGYWLIRWTDSSREEQVGSYRLRLDIPVEMTVLYYEVDTLEIKKLKFPYRRDQEEAKDIAPNMAGAWKCFISDA